MNNTLNVIRQYLLIERSIAYYGNKETKIEKFIKQLNPKSLYGTTLDDLKRYNRADTVNISEEEINRFRYIAGTKQTLSG